MNNVLQTYIAQFSYVFVTTKTSIRHLVLGVTKTGKTTFFKKLLSNAQVMIDPPPEDIKYFYSEYQDTFAEIKSLVLGIEFVEGVPDAISDSIYLKTRNLYIFDDMMGERDAVFAELFAKKSHHGNLSVIYIVQNVFHQSKDHHTISLNASYIVLTRNVRDGSQVIHLAKQIYPHNAKFFQLLFVGSKDCNCQRKIVILF